MSFLTKKHVWEPVVTKSGTYGAAKKKQAYEAVPPSIVLTQVLHLD